MVRRKKVRTRGKLQLSKYFQELKKGDFVAVVKEPSVNSNFPERLQDERDNPQEGPLPRDHAPKRGRSKHKAHSGQLGLDEKEHLPPASASQLCRKGFDPCLPSFYGQGP